MVVSDPTPIPNREDLSSVTMKREGYASLTLSHFGSHPFTMIAILSFVHS